MIAAFLAALLVAMLVGAWFGGYYVERFLLSQHAWPVTRRAAGMLLALWGESAIIYAAWRMFG